MPDVNTIIANRALTKLGAETLADYDDDTNAGRAVRAVYDGLRDDVLREANWNFALTRASLSALSDAPAWGYARQFQAPADCLRLVQVSDFWDAGGLADYRNSSDALWAYEGGRILTDLGAPLPIRYVARRETDFDPHFAEAFASRLAMELAERLTQSGSKRDAMEAAYVRAMARARHSNAIEKAPESPGDDSWLLGRR